jgi:hypothetical protein
VQLYRYFVSQSSEFCRHNLLKGRATNNTKGKPILLYQLSPKTFGYTLVWYEFASKLIHFVHLTVRIYLIYLLTASKHVTPKESNLILPKYLKYKYVFHWTGKKIQKYRKYSQYRDINDSVAKQIRYCATLVEIERPQIQFGAQN